MEMIAVLTTVRLLVKHRTAVLKYWSGNKPTIIKLLYKDCFKFYQTENLS